MGAPHKPPYPSLLKFEPPPEIDFYDVSDDFMGGLFLRMEGRGGLCKSFWASVSKLKSISDLYKLEFTETSLQG